MSPARPNVRSASAAEPPKARLRDRVRAYAKAYRQANLEKARQRDQSYRDRNREESNRRRRERYQARRQLSQANLEE